MKKENNNDLGASTRKKLESIIEQSKTENEALKKILQGLERIKQDNEKRINKNVKK